MAFSIARDSVISYGPETLEDFQVYGFEWIDNLHFLVKPSVFLGDRAESYISAARKLFLKAGWQGDGDIELLWLPPFVFPLSLKVPFEGLIIWHVKQEEDGISFLLSPIQLPFEEFEGVR